LAPEALRRYALDGKTQTRGLEAVENGCELFARAIHSFNQTIAS